MAIKAKKTIPYNFSEKHMEYIRRCRECVYNVAEGAVRAGKTVDNVIAFCKELRDTPDKLHLATASTAATAKLIIGDCNGFGIEHYFRGQCRWGKFKGNEALIVCGKFTNGKTKIVMFVGGGKSDSYKKFRGASIGMWIATEIDLHHEETIREAVTRQAAAKRRKIFWDLNPCTPGAIIYKNYIDEYAKKAADGTLIGGYNYGHFTIADNINITDGRREAFISQYSVNTAEYRRKVLGIRCPADGLIFQQFADDPEKFIADKKYSGVKFISVGVDFGGHKSKTTFVASAILGNFQSLGVIADYKMQGGKGTVDPDRINRELITFYKYVHALYPNARILYIDCDNASQELINGIRIPKYEAAVEKVKASYKKTEVPTAKPLSVAAEIDNDHKFAVCTISADGLVTPVKPNIATVAEAKKAMLELYESKKGSVKCQFIHPQTLDEKSAELYKNMSQEMPDVTYRIHVNPRKNAAADNTHYLQEYIKNPDDTYKVGEVVCRGNFDKCNAALADMLKNGIDRVQDKNIEKPDFEIYQIKNTDENRSIRFEPLESLAEQGLKPDFSNYDKVYEGDMSTVNVRGDTVGDKLEAVFVKFNLDRPEDFTGHSLSVSDVVVMDDKAYYVDTVGFQPLKEFKPIEKNIEQEKAEAVPEQENPKTPKKPKL